MGYWNNNDLGVWQNGYSIFYTALMELGTLFRIKKGGDIYTAKQSIEGRCLGCVGEYNRNTCQALPPCFETNAEGAVVFSKLGTEEVAKAIASKQTIFLSKDLRDSMYK